MLFFCFPWFLVLIIVVFTIALTCLHQFFKRILHFHLFCLFDLVSYFLSISLRSLMYYTYILHDPYFSTSCIIHPNWCFLWLMTRQGYPLSDNPEKIVFYVRNFRIKTRFTAVGIEIIKQIFDSDLITNINQSNFLTRHHKGKKMKREISRRKRCETWISKEQGRA